MFHFSLSLSLSLFANNQIMACSLSELIGLAIVALLLFSMSNRVQYYTKMIIFMVSSLVASCVPIPIMLPRPKDYRNALIPAWCIVQVGRLLGVSFEVQGIENLNSDEGGIVLINHQSAIDLIGELQQQTTKNCNQY
jgi:lysophosphatidate acyltransferase